MGSPLVDFITKIANSKQSNNYLTYIYFIPRHIQYSLAHYIVLLVVKNGKCVKVKVLLRVIAQCFVIREVKCAVACS